jgi:hypothetical protein
LLLVSCGRREEQASIGDRASLEEVVTNVIEDDKRRERQEIADRNQIMARAEDAMRACVFRWTTVEDKDTRDPDAISESVAAKCANEYDTLTDLKAAAMEGDVKQRADFRTQRGLDAARVAAVLPVPRTQKVPTKDLSI